MVSAAIISTYSENGNHGVTIVQSQPVHINMIKVLVTVTIIAVTSWPGCPKLSNHVLFCFPSGGKTKEPRRTTIRPWGTRSKTGRWLCCTNWIQILQNGTTAPRRWIPRIFCCSQVPRGAPVWCHIVSRRPALDWRALSPCPSQGAGTGRDRGRDLGRDPGTWRTQERKR